MSSYQYYEFQAIDRLLTEEEQRAVAGLSSRVAPDPRLAVFVYHWGRFPADPREILLRYYDAMLYQSSWGSRQILYRFPQAAVEVERAMAYCEPLIVEDYLSISTEGAYSLLSIAFDEVWDGEWVEEPVNLSVMISLRDDLVRGDYRALYLAWLKVLEVEDLLDSVCEPPVPPGLKALSPALRALADFLGIDGMLIQAAAEASGEPPVPPADWLWGAVGRLAEEERDGFLLRLARGEAHLSAALNRRLREVAPWPEAEAPRRRTVGELVRAAETIGARAQWHRAAEAEARRIAGLEALASREAEVWDEVEALIERMQPKSYDEAVQLLVELRELAEYEGKEEAFQQRVDDIYERYPRRSSLLRRLQDAGLRPRG